MKGLALTLVIGSIILAGCFQLSSAAPASSAHVADAANPNQDQSGMGDDDQFHSGRGGGNA